MVGYGSQTWKDIQKPEKSLVLNCWRLVGVTNLCIEPSWKAFAKKNSKIKQYSSGSLGAKRDETAYESGN